MTYQDYLAKTNFDQSTKIQITQLETFVTYEEVFKWRWLATKLKIFSFVAYSPEITKAQLTAYSGACLNYAELNKKGLPKGFQNGIVSNNVLVSENVSPDAAAYAAARPDKHFSAFEMPVVFDLSAQTLHTFTGDIVWGMIYNSFIKETIRSKFKI
jgi:hypothetical protein